MFAAAIIIFREVFEIALLLSVIMAATRDIAGRAKTVFVGLGAGIGGAALIAYFANEISNMAEGVGQELFNAAILFAATLMIGWTVIWMSRHARELSRHIKKLGQEIALGNAPLYSMAVVIAIAVLREGAEIVLFIYGMIASKQPIVDIVFGGVIGFSGGAISGLLLYFGLVSISPKHIFTTTTWMLIFLASGMASLGAAAMVSAGYFADFANIVWDSSQVISEDGIAGRVLHVLLGYSARPMQIQLAFYAATLIILSIGVALLKREKKK